MNTIQIFLVVLGFIPYAHMSKFLILRPPTCDEYNRSYLGNFSIAYNNYKLSVDMDLTKPLHAGLRVHMDLFTRKFNSKSFQSFYQYSIDMCSMLTKLRSNIFKKWFSTLLPYGNFKKRCPVPPSHYYLKDFKMNELEIPTFLFTGFYRLTFNMVQSKNQNESADFIIRCVTEVEIK